MSSMRGSSIEELLIIGGLLLVQGVYGVYTIFLNRILSLGLSPLFMIFVGSLVGAVFLLPFAIVLERKKWPAKLTSTMMVQFGFISFGGVTMYQGLLLMGIKKTTPVIASAMPNLIPGFVFIIATLFRFEKFSIWCKYSQAKLLGTIVCLAGAIAMSLLQSPTTTKLMFTDNSNNDWILGCFYLLAAFITVSCIMVLQAAIMVSFPAPFSLCVITALMGSILTGILQIVTEGKLDVGSPNMSLSSIIAIVVVSSIISTTCVVYQSWCVNKKGPLLVSIFSPIQTVFTTSLSIVLFGQAISLERVTTYQGLLLMGIKRTTPVITYAMPNLILGFVFIIATTFRFEKFSIWGKYRQAKLLGTIVCLGVAVAMSLLQSSTTTKLMFTLGCFYLLAAFTTVACIVVLQRFMLSYGRIKKKSLNQLKIMIECHICLLTLRSLYCHKIIRFEIFSIWCKYSQA